MKTNPQPVMGYSFRHFCRQSFNRAMGWYLPFYQVRSFQSAQSWPWWWTQSKPEISALFLTLINFLEAQKLSIQLPQATNGRWTYLSSRSTASEDWRVPKAKPSRHLCILRLAFLFPSEEPNHGGPDVAQRDPNEQESISVTKENWLLQILIAGWRGRVSNSYQKLVQLLEMLTKAKRTINYGCSQPKAQTVLLSFSHRPPTKQPRNCWWN